MEARTMANASNTETDLAGIHTRTLRLPVTIADAIVPPSHGRELLRAAEGVIPGTAQAKGPCAEFRSGERCVRD
jgi:hypothetical protein